MQNNLKCGLQPGDFTFGEVLSSGSFGFVLKAMSKNPTKQFAIKIITIEPNNQKTENEKEIQSEILILEKITTTNPRPQAIPQYYGYFIQTNTMQQDNYVMVFDYFPTNLRGFLQNHIDNNQPINFNDLKNIYQALLNGLSFLQSLNFCLRDISSKSLMIDNKGALQIIDFELSRDIEDLAVNQNEIDLTATTPEILEAWIVDIDKVFFLKY